MATLPIDPLTGPRFVRDGQERGHRARLTAMTEGWSDFVGRLDHALGRFDREGARRLAYELTGRIHQGEILPATTAACILGKLRRKRFFELIEQLAETFRFVGTDDPQIRRQYAQALIDQRKIEKAIDTLEAIDSRTRGTDPDENAEAKGLIGRIYKQLYINAVNSDPTALASPLVRGYLQRAIDQYWSVHRTAPRERLWHGINVVALAARAAADGVPLTAGPEVKAIAEAILTDIEGRGEKVSTWDLATAVEACVALGRNKEALGWLGDYVRRKDADAFELTSTLRQLKEVWRLTPDKPPGSTLLPVLEAQVLRREEGGGRIELTGPEVKSTLERAAVLERTLGKEGAVSLAWYRTGLERCRAVAQIRTHLGEGVGTGFLLGAQGLNAKLGRGELLLLTNAHVVSDDETVREKDHALHPRDAAVVFEADEQGRGKSATFRVAALLWTSPPDELDASLLLLEPAPRGMEPCPIASEVPPADGKHKAYIIGHPLGGGLALSLYDNVLLANDGRRMHYRSPTEPGSSGSPVFDDEWRLIGVHHAYRSTVAGPDGANEGIAIHRILEAVRAANVRWSPSSGQRETAATRGRTSSKSRYGARGKPTRASIRRLR